MKKWFLCLLLVLMMAGGSYAGSTTNFGWDYGTEGQDPWWDVWTTIFGAIDTDLNNLQTVVGVVQDAVSLGTFTGSTIADNQTVKQALQALETSVETKGPGDITTVGDIASGDALTSATPTTTYHTDIITAGPWVDVRKYMDGAGGRPTLATWQANKATTDVTTVITAAVAAGLHVRFTESGTYRISDEISLNDNQTIEMNAGVTIRQYGANKNIFKIVQKDNVWIHANGGILYGEGTWSGDWTGNSGHEDRAIQFLGATRSGITFPVIKNCGSAGIAIIGGNNITITSPIIEGTHAYSTALPSQANYQNGIYITDSVTYGIANDIVIISPNISGTAHGLLREALVGTTTVTGTALQVVNPHIHDIPGQHGFYIQTGNVTVSNPTFAGIELSAIKVLSGEANLDLVNVSLTGVTGENIGNALFEMSETGTGSLSNLLLTGVGDTVGYGLTVTGKVQRLKADLAVSNAGQAVYITGANAKDLDISVLAQNIEQDGILINATNATGIKIRPTIREPNTTTTPTGCGILVSSASAAVEIIDPDVTDASTKMVYGLFNNTLGSTVDVRGTNAIFTGASDYAVRATGAINSWPLKSTLSGTSGTWLGTAPNISINPVGAGAATVGANTVLTTATGESLLSATTVAFNANADTTLYTVPAGKRCVLTKAVVVAGADAGATTQISIGADGAETDWIPANTLSNLDAQYDAVILMPVPNTTPLKIKSYAATTVIQAQVSNQSGGATNTVYLYGILY